MSSNTDVKPVKTFRENDPRPEFLLIWDPKIIPHISKSTCNEHVNSILMWNLWKLLDKVTRGFFTYLGAQKLGLWGHIVDISGSSCKVHVKQDWCESRETFNKIVQNLNLYSFGSSKWPKNLGLHTYKISSNELINQVLRGSSGNFSRK